MWIERAPQFLGNPKNLHIIRFVVAKSGRVSRFYYVPAGFILLEWMCDDPRSREPSETH